MQLSFTLWQINATTIHIKYSETEPLHKELIFRNYLFPLIENECKNFATK